MAALADGGGAAMEKVVEVSGGPLPVTLWRERKAVTFNCNAAAPPTNLPGARFSEMGGLR